MKLTEAEILSLMREAVRQAHVAMRRGEVPVGAVVEKDGVIVGRGRNETRARCDTSAHAEVIALARAAKREDDFRLDGCRVFVTIEPCLMCLGAIWLSRIREVYFGVRDPKFGGLFSPFGLAEHPALRRMRFTGGIMADEIAAMMKGFFREKR